MLLSPYIQNEKSINFDFLLLKFSRKVVLLATVHQKVIKKKVAQVFHNAKQTAHNAIIIVYTYLSECKFALGLIFWFDHSWCIYCNHHFTIFSFLQ